MILRTGSGNRSAVDLGMELLDKFKNLDGIANAGIDEMIGKNGVKGIGKAKAAEIKAAIEMADGTRSPNYRAHLSVPALT